MKTGRESSISIGGCLVIPTATTRGRPLAEGTRNHRTAVGRKARASITGAAQRDRGGRGGVERTRDAPGARSLILVANATWRPGFVEPWFRPLSHKGSSWVCLSIFQADSIGTSILLYGAVGVNRLSNSIC